MKEQILPLPTDVEKLINKIGSGKYKIIVFLLEEYDHLTKKQARRVIAKEYHIDINDIKTIQNQ